MTNVIRIVCLFLFVAGSVFLYAETASGEAEEENTEEAAEAPADGEAKPDETTAEGEADPEASSEDQGSVTSDDKAEKEKLEEGEKKKDPAAQEEHSNPWAHALALERASLTRMRRAEVALELAVKRLKDLEDLHKKLTELRKQKQAETATRQQTLEKLATLYSKMKVDNAGKVLEAFDVATASDVLALMDSKKAAKIIATMDPAVAAKLLQHWTTTGKK